MPACRMCKQFYPESQFISGNGPRYQVCARCGVESGLATREETPQLYSDELVNARFILYTKRVLPWFVLLVGWILYISIGRGIELWSSILFVILLISSLLVPVIHILRSTKFSAELSRLTP